MLKNTKLLKAHGYINGEWVGDNTESRFEVTNAYTNEVISTLPEMGKKETNDAIEQPILWIIKPGKHQAHNNLWDNKGKEKQRFIQANAAHGLVEK